MDINFYDLDFKFPAVQTLNVRARACLAGKSIRMRASLAGSAACFPYFAKT